jgi:hypothetical protein
MDEKEIEAFIKNEKKEVAAPVERPTYTKMSRKHLSIETLRVYNIDYVFDEVSSTCTFFQTRADKKQDPDYVLIKRWVPG